MRNYKCIICGTLNDNIVIRENGYNGIKCKKCSLIYIAPKLTENKIKNIYVNDNAIVSVKSHIQSSNVKKIYARHIIKIIKKYKNQGNLLEIGSGAGNFLIESQKRDLNVTGIELNNIARDYIKNDLKIKCLKAISKNTKYDIIYHGDVLSHFINPIAEFRRFNKLLKKDGLLIFETGNFGDVDNKYYQYITPFQYPDHLYLFSKMSLQKLLKQTGFKLIKCYKYSLLPRLIVSKLIKNIKNIFNIKNKHQINKNKSLKKDENVFINLYKDTKGQISCFYQYYIGYIIPKKKHPQTLIIIARK